MGKFAVHLPVTTSALGAPPALFFVVDAVGQKLTKAMPAGLAKHHAARIAKKIGAAAPAPTAGISEIRGTTPTAVIVDEIGDGAPVWVGLDLAAVGEVTRQSSPYLVTLELPVAGLTTGAIDAAWPDLVDQLANALEKQRGIIEQEPDLKPTDFAWMKSGYTVGTSSRANGGGQVVCLVIDPATYPPNNLQADSPRLVFLIKQSIAGLTSGAMGA